MDKPLNIFLDNRHVARLWLDNKYYCFQYVTDDIPPISLTLPVRKEPYLRDEAKPYFANLLPEGATRNTIETKMGLTRGDDFELLKRIGGDCAGAITVFPEGEFPEANHQYTALSSNELERLIKDLPQNPLYIGYSKSVRLSLAGAQHKVALLIDGGVYSLPENGAPSSHILKVPISNIPGIADTVENEVFSMMFAREVGLDVPDVDLVTIGGIPVFVTRRYDREIDSSGRLRRLLQEDFCQLMVLEPTVKYQHAGGPSLEDCANKIREHSVDGITDIEQLVRWSLFNVIIGNADAHGKNISVLLGNGGVRLAPFYDIMSTRVYGQAHDKELAMSIGRKYNPDDLTRENWKQMAEFMDISYKLVRRVFEDISGMVDRGLAKTVSDFHSVYGPAEIVDRIAEDIDRQNKILRGII